MSPSPSLSTQVKRLPTFRSISSTLSSESKGSSASDISARAGEMVTRAKNNVPLTDDELNGILFSIQNVLPHDYDVSYENLEQLLREIAHISHKDWSVTSQNSERLGKVLFRTESGFSAEVAPRQMLERILTEGNWERAKEHAKTLPSSSRPWAVLVTGVNGIRKTTSMYQPWFPALLQEALVPPTEDDMHLDPALLPSGLNSFFRQLDHMIATLCNEDFAQLYSLTSDLLAADPTDPVAETPPKEIIQKYTNLKAAIFARYRTLSELLGALLLREAQTININCMMETSGRDVAMFHYVDYFFPKGYNKLALHFQISNLELAKASVDFRMVQEIRAGVKAVSSQVASVFDIIYTNAGGPYGSEVLHDIQEDSDSVWNTVVMSDGEGVGKDWFKATIQINAYDHKPWTAQAVRPDGSFGKEYEFVR